MALLRAEKAALAQQVLQEHALFEAVKRRAEADLARADQRPGRAPPGCGGFPCRPTGGPSP